MHGVFFPIPLSVLCFAVSTISLSFVLVSPQSSVQVSVCSLCHLSWCPLCTLYSPSWCPHCSVICHGLQTVLSSVLMFPLFSLIIYPGDLLVLSVISPGVSSGLLSVMVSCQNPGVLLDWFVICHGFPSVLPVISPVVLSALSFHLSWCPFCY